MEAPGCNFKPVLTVVTPISKMAGRLKNSGSSIPIRTAKLNKEAEEEYLYDAENDEENEEEFA